MSPQNDQSLLEYLGVNKYSTMSRRERMVVKLFLSIDSKLATVAT